MKRLLLIGALLALAPAARASELPDHLLPDERNTIEIFQRTAESVVFIHNVRLQRNMFSRNVMEIPQGAGSGFVWDSEGHIVTNYHVVRGGNQFLVTFSDGKTYEAEAVGGDMDKDLAVLKVDAPRDRLVPLRLGNSDVLLVGQKVLAIGNPFGLDQTLTTGVISALDREIRSIADRPITGVIQTDASINPGNSGGPLLDSRGRLIGVATAILARTGADVGIGFAVPVNTVLRIVPQVIERGVASRAGLGIQIVADRTMQQLGLDGVGIGRVESGSPASRAGFEPLQIDRRGRVSGDIIVQIDDQEVLRFDDLYKALDRHRPGDRVEVVVLRNGKQRKVLQTQLVELSQR